MDELKYNQLKQEMGRLSSEMKKGKQEINISVERIGDTIQDSVVSGYKKTKDTPDKGKEEDDSIALDSKEYEEWRRGTEAE